MASVQSGDTSIYMEETGSGTPVVFVHEFSGDHRTWEPQVRYFSRRYRCVVFNARGYPPSDVPENPDAYSQGQAVEDLLAVLDACEMETAHIVGLSMGGFAALHFGLAHPDRVRSLAIGAVGYGTSHDDGWKEDVEHLADFYRDDPIGAASAHASAPGRIPFLLKDPRGWVEFADQLAEHPSIGSSNTMRGVQGRRPNLYDLEAELSALAVPLLVMCGDEDEQCLEPSLYLKRTVSTAGLVVLPRTGHTLNLEEPARFNELVLDFLTSVDSGDWAPRDPRSAPGRNPLGNRNDS